MGLVESGGADPGGAAQGICAPHVSPGMVGRAPTRSFPAKGAANDCDGEDFNERGGSSIFWFLTDADQIVMIETIR